MYVYKEVLSVSTRNGTDIYVSLKNIGNTRVLMMYHKYACDHMHVYKQLLKVWALARAQTYV